MIGRQILVAEDEAMIALQLEELLQNLGCEVVGPVSRLEEVVQTIESQRLDGAVLDVNLRGESVLSVLPRLKQIGLPFLLTSGYDAASLFPPEFQDVPRAAKPFSEDQLRQLCLELFARE